MIAGELEGKKYTDNMHAIADLLRSQSKSNIYDKVIPSGQHNETFWRTQLQNYFKWLLPLM
jgi:S-formylglutathione hydrolase FrmB